MVIAAPLAAPTFAYTYVLRCVRLVSAPGGIYPAESGLVGSGVCAFCSLCPELCLCSLSMLSLIHLQRVNRASPAAMGIKSEV